MVPRIAGGAAILLLLAAPILVHRLALGTSAPWIVAGAAAAQAAVLAWIIGGRWGSGTRITLALCALGLVAAIAALPGVTAHDLEFGMAAGGHALAYGALLVWFASSLRAGREPVVTGFARRIRATMPSRVVRYTRKVTIAWSVFFAAQIILSAALLLVAPEAVWSSFVSVLNLPLIIAMMLGEYACRLALFRHEPRTSLATTVLALRTMRGAPGGRR